MGLRKKILNKVKTIFGGESSRGENQLENNTLPETQTTDKQDPNYQKNVDSSKVYTFQGIDPSTLENRNHNATPADDKDRQLLAPPDQSPIGLSPYGSIGVHGVTNSGVSVGGGTVTVNNEIHNHSPSGRIRPGLKLLQKRVATSAFHNSAQRVDPPRCHPDTRVTILKQIYDWIFLDLFIRQTWILWMHGAAGAGKSAIMQSIAELCEQGHIPLASFFFVRTDATRNSMAPFIATLVYQLIQLIPQVREEILGIIEKNPLVFDQSLKFQLETLIIQPILRLQKHFKTFFIIMIDGLDECIERAHQADLIKLLGTISRSRTTPLIFLVASRREPQIEGAFLLKEVSDLVLTLPLDNSDIEQTSDDIRHFLVDKFTDIKETHLFKRHLPIEWPAASVVEEIVDKSSGQFIFASVVINYVSSPRTNPVTQLEIIRGIRVRGPSSQNPFAQLDALYQHILSQVEALDMVFDIIAWNLLAPGWTTSSIQNIFRLEDGKIDVLFADLAAIILCEPHTDTEDHPQLKFLHASFPDFLLDKSRSEKYHIDLDEYRTKLLCMFFKRHPPILDPLWSGDNLELMIRQEQCRLWGIRYLLEGAKVSERLHSAIMNFNSTFYNKTFFERRWYNIGSNILSPLKKLDFNDQGEAYHHVLDVLAAEYAKYWPSLADSQKGNLRHNLPDLVICIDQIRMQVI